MNITLHQLRVLKAVKTHGSITLAAQALHITQPAVSNILKQLELSYDYPLTETIGKKVFLTKAGERLVEAVQQIDLILETTTSDINAQHGKISGTVVVAIVSTAKYFVPKLLGEFRKKYPEIKIKLTVCNRQQAIQILKSNASDFLIMSQPPDDMITDKKLFYKDQLVVVASPEMKFAKNIKQLKDLNDYAWIIREPGSGTRIVMKKLFKKYKMLPNIVMEVGNNESIKQLIMANMGISIVSKQSIELELQLKLIKILPINNFPLHHPWYFVRNKGKHVSRVASEFFKFTQQQNFNH
jgi:LysR family transcriptional regulator, low CO2-responsive transcriptional regulator